MLTHLTVRNLAVIEEASVDFGPGLNVLTGETGAGKSILVDALALLSGARATSDLIRRGADRLTVGGIFRPRGSEWRRVLGEGGIDPQGDELVIRREVSRDGPNRVFAEDEPVTLRLLADVAPYLLKIHTQREELNLVSPEFQRQLLDRSGGDEAARLLEITRSAYSEYQRGRQRLDRLAGDERARLERLDLLRFHLREIEEADMRVGEEDAIRAERQVLRHSEAIRMALGDSFDRLFDRDGSAAEELSASVRGLREVTNWEPAARGWIDELEEVRIRLEETSRDIGHRLQEVEADPARLNEIEERLALLERLFRKYGGSSEEVLQYRSSIEDELRELTLDDEGRRELEHQCSALLETFRSRARDLSNARRAWAERLARGVHRELADLAMSRARFSIEFSTRPLVTSLLEIDGRAVEFGPEGFDEISFQLAANPGEATGPLSSVASGGELSRVYLALRLAVMEEGGETGASLVFDEIDAGIGGAEAAALGSKLRRLGAGAQVFAVTHLPQVASQGHSHFRVRKAVRGGRTRITVGRLDRESRVEEVARMLAGKEVTSLSRTHAEELLSRVG